MYGGFAVWCQLQMVVSYNAYKNMNRISQKAAIKACPKDGFKPGINGISGASSDVGTVRQLSLRR